MGIGPDESCHPDSRYSPVAAQVPAEAVRELAHELNNLLAIIRLYVQLVARRSGDDASRRQIHEIEQTVGAAAAVVAQLHGLASAVDANSLEIP